MKRQSLLLFLCAISLGMFSIQAGAVITKTSLLDSAKKHVTSRMKPIDPKALEIGLKAYSCAVKMGKSVKKDLVTIIDYTKPSTEHRFWVYNVKKQELVTSQLVAHGQNSGDLIPTQFSNREGSHQSSFGVFMTGNVYEGKNGISLRLNGLEHGINDHALDRAIVIHGAPYVNDNYVSKFGRIGRSWGCPALDSQQAESTIQTIKEGSLVVAYTKDMNWMKKSEFLHCS